MFTIYERRQAAVCEIQTAGFLTLFQLTLGIDPSLGRSSLVSSSVCKELGTLVFERWKSRRILPVWSNCFRKVLLEIINMRR
ncbi:hypothetical protein LINPERPRIM_LOCUS24005 [Linum perenne]